MRKPHILTRSSTYSYFPTHIRSNLSSERAKFLQRKAERSAKLNLDDPEESKESSSASSPEKSRSSDSSPGAAGDKESKSTKSPTLLDEVMSKPQQIQNKELLSSTFGSMNVDTWEGGKTATDKALSKDVKKQGTSGLDKFDLEYERFFLSFFEIRFFF